MNSPKPEEIFELRKKLGMTQEQAAATIGLNKDTWGGYERGDFRMIFANWVNFHVQNGLPTKHLRGRKGHDI